jgi:hypothetical protein
MYTAVRCVGQMYVSKESCQNHNFCQGKLQILYVVCCVASLIMLCARYLFIPFNSQKN